MIRVLLFLLLLASPALAQGRFFVEVLGAISGLTSPTRRPLA